MKGSVGRNACETLSGARMRLYVKHEVDACRNVRVTAGHRDRQTNRQTDRQTDRQTNSSLYIRFPCPASDVVCMETRGSLCSVKCAQSLKAQLHMLAGNL